jgi:hypothetical protein
MNERHVQLVILLVARRCVDLAGWRPSHRSVVGFLTDLSFPSPTGWRAHRNPPAGVCRQDGTIAPRRVEGSVEA